MKLKSKYAQNYSQTSLFGKIKKYARKAGLHLTYAVFLLYNVLEDKDTPSKAKLIIASALGYFILPFDWIPDFIPITGFTDDFSALILAIQQTSKHIKPKHIQKAREQITKWFGYYSEDELINVEKYINKNPSE